MATVFVTVGTTSFDELIETATSEKFRGLLVAKGYKKLVLQIGRGKFQPSSESAVKLEVSFYDYKSSLADDIRQADLVISHAGAGCCLETMAAGKPLVVAVNEKLMGNHQLELARQLHRDGHIAYGVCRELYSILESLDVASLEPFPDGKPELFAQWLSKSGSERTAYQKGVTRGRYVFLAVCLAALAVLLAIWV